MALFTVDDMSVIDNTETVTYQDMGLTEGFTNYPNVLAFREALPTTYHNGVVQQSCRFHLQASTINSGTTAPTLDSRILDSFGVTWVIVNVDLFSWKTRYEVDTLQLMS